GIRSLVQVTVLEVVEVLLHPSLAVNVLVCVCVHVPVTGPSVNDTVGEPHASVAVAVPNAASIAAAAGLHASVRVVPVAVIACTVKSTILVVAGDDVQPAIVLAPAGVVPHAALSTYLVLIL